MNIFLYVLILVCLCNAQTYRATKTQVDTVGIGSFMTDLSAFLDKPLNWCSITPIGDVITNTSYYSDSVTIDISLNVICDEATMHTQFIHFIKKHQLFMDTHEKLVDNMVSKQYPDYQIFWSNLTDGIGVEIDCDTVAYIRGVREYGFSLHNDKKAMFVSMQVGNYTTKPMYIALNDNTISTKPITTTTDTQTFRVNIPSKYITTVNDFEFTLNRIWHTTKNQQAILDNKWKI